MSKKESSTSNNGSVTFTGDNSNDLKLPSSPRTVIRGERLTSTHKEGDSKEIAQTIPAPVPKRDAEPQAALTDYLNTTFPFVSSEENIINLVKEFRFMLGDAFGSLKQRNGGLHGYKFSFDVGNTSAEKRGTDFIYPEFRYFKT